MTRLLLADPFPAARLADLRALGLDVEYDPELTAETLPTAAKGVAILVVRSTKVTRATLDAGASLALVIRAGAGVDTIDVDAASERGVLVAKYVDGDRVPQKVITDRVLKYPKQSLVYSVGL